MFLAASLTLIVKSPLGTIHMDINTIRNLELVRNIRSGDWKHSLMGYMNHCKTSMGSRLLRASILQPMQSGSNAEKLNARLDVSGVLQFSVLRCCALRAICWSYSLQHELRPKSSFMRDTGGRIDFAKRRTLFWRIQTACTASRH